MTSKEALQARIAEIEAAMGASDFWTDKAKAQTALKEYQDLKAKLAGGGGYDKSDALVTIVSGAGGDDAEDFSRILFELYTKYASARTHVAFQFRGEAANVIFARRGTSEVARCRRDAHPRHRTRGNHRALGW